MTDTIYWIYLLLFACLGYWIHKVERRLNGYAGLLHDHNNEMHELRMRVDRKIEHDLHMVFNGVQEKGK